MKLTSIIVGITLVLKSNALERLEPIDRCYFGITVDSSITVDSIRAQFGITPAVFVAFYSFPLSDSLRKNATNFLEQVRAVHGIALLTLEPFSGLETLTQQDYQQAADLCATAESRGITGIFIRFGHEMNGNWYAWGQRPILYKHHFRLFAQEIRQRTKRTAMVWAPNYGIGYPFGNPRPAPGSAEFKALDTNGDNLVTDKDDMYEPYYPGDDAVDWVGMTIYHWGIQYPWLENELPEKDSFARSLTGRYQGSIPNFYSRYCMGHGKPMAVPETAAFYNTEQGGPAELTLKKAWWQQVFAAAPLFPKLKCINWFNEYKRESEAKNNLIDWRISADPIIREAFLNDLLKEVKGRPYFMLAEDARWAALPLVANIERRGSTVFINCLGKPSERYQLFETTNGQSWFPVGNLIQGNGEQLIWSGPISQELRLVIYHIQVTAGQ